MKTLIRYAVGAAIITAAVSCVVVAYGAHGTPLPVANPVAWWSEPLLVLLLAGWCARQIRAR